MFKNSRELALIFSKFAPFLANKSQYENYGTILKLFNDRIFEVNEENCVLIVNSFMNEYKNGYKGLEIRYTDEQVQIFFNQLQDILNTRLNEAKNKIK